MPKENRLTPIRFDHRNKNKQAHWLYQCSCGNQKIILQDNVKRNHTTSCGCRLKEWAKEMYRRNVTHGMSYTSEYHIWQSMKRRCYDPKNAQYKYYGGRGIKYCDRREKFENFLLDRGARPEGKSLDRIDNNGGYSPENCRWADDFQQNSNRRGVRLLQINGEIMSIPEAVRRFQIEGPRPLR